MKVLVVEDEFNSRRLLRKLLADEFAGLNLIEASSVEEAVILINEEMPQIILCDIQLRNEKSFDIFVSVQVDFELIFVTAHAEFALRAFDLGAAQYILKPINRHKLYAAMYICMERIALKADRSQAEIKQDFEATNLNKLLLPGNQSTKVIDVEKIIFCKADGVYCMVHLEGGKEELVVKPLGFIENRLIDHPHFFRAHKSYLININKVMKISGDKSLLTLSNNEIIPVGRSKKSELQRLLKDVFF